MGGGGFRGQTYLCDVHDLDGGKLPGLDMSTLKRRRDIETMRASVGTAVLQPTTLKSEVLVCLRMCI